MPPQTGNTIQFLQSFLHSYFPAMQSLPWKYCWEFIQGNLNNKVILATKKVRTEILYSSCTNLGAKLSWTIPLMIFVLLNSFLNLKNKLFFPNWLNFIFFFQTMSTHLSSNKPIKWMMCFSHVGLNIFAFLNNEKKNYQCSRGIFKLPP